MDSKGLIVHVLYTYRIVVASSLYVQSEQGNYISWFSGEVFQGGLVYTRNYTLSEIPIFVQAGSIIPMKAEGFGN